MRLQLCKMQKNLLEIKRGSTTSCSVLTSPNKDETGLLALAC